ncbi:MAG: hypothetical protein AAGB12_04485 [Pseudomonadota bacterium]
MLSYNGQSTHKIFLDFDNKQQDIKQYNSVLAIISMQVTELYWSTPPIRVNKENSCTALGDQDEDVSYHFISETQLIIILTYLRKNKKSIDLNFYDEKQRLLMTFYKVLMISDQ